MDNNTKINKVKEYLESGNYINDVKAAELFKSYRLSGIIYDLRHNKDLNIQDRWITNENTGSRYKEYYLVKGSYNDGKSN